VTRGGWYVLAWEALPGRAKMSKALAAWAAAGGHGRLSDDAPRSRPVLGRAGARPAARSRARASRQCREAARRDPPGGRVALRLPRDGATGAGRHGTGYSTRERAEFIRLSTGRLEQAYVEKIQAYAGDRIVYLGESIDQAYARVRAKIVTAGRGEIPVE